MSDDFPGWCVITGAPCSGKSTILNELESRGNSVIYEVARTYIDQELAKGRTLQDIRKDEGEFQMEVLRRKLQLESELNPDSLIFLERGIPDSVAYAELIGLQLDPETVKRASNCSQYSKVFLLQRLKEYQVDYARTESEEEVERLHNLLHKVYAENAGTKLVIVPVIPLQERIQFILDHLK